MARSRHRSLRPIFTMANNKMFDGPDPYPQPRTTHAVSLLPAPPALCPSTHSHTQLFASESKNLGKLRTGVWRLLVAELKGALMAAQPNQLNSHSTMKAAEALLGCLRFRSPLPPCSENLQPLIILRLRQARRGHGGRPGRGRWVFGFSCSESYRTDLHDALRGW